MPVKRRQAVLKRLQRIKLVIKTRKDKGKSYGKLFEEGI